VVGEGVVSRVDSDSVGIGRTPVADSSEVAALSVGEGVSVALVTADSTVPEPVVDASEAEEPVEVIEEASESDALEVADDSPVAVDWTADVTSPDPTAVDSVLSDVGIGTTGMMVLPLEVVVGSLELPEAMVDGSSVGYSVVCSTAVGTSPVVDDAEAEDAELPVPTALEDTVVETGTGTAVVPLLPVDVLRL